MTPAASPAYGAQVPTYNGCPATSPLLMFLAASLASVSKNRQHQHEAAKARSVCLLPDYDYVVAGGGAAGCVLASRLSECGASVLLLERGGREPPEARVPGLTTNNLGSAMMEFIQTLPDIKNCNGTGCVLNVPTVLGGGSTVNGMLYVRGSGYIYDQWAKVTGDERWSYKRVLPYFKKAEDNLNPDFMKDTRYHGTGGPLKVSLPLYQHPVVPLLAKALQETGIQERFDINAESQLGYSNVQMNQAHGERWSAFRSYLEPVLHRPNLRVETFATARRVLLDGGKDAPRAVGVEFVDAKGEVRVVKARREVILTAGALHTPQILMMSGIGPAEHLKALRVPIVKDLPVGNTLKDHVDIPALRYKCGPPLCVTDWSSHVRDLKQYNQNRTGPLAANNALNFMAFWRSSLARPETGKTPDLQVMFLGNTVNADAPPGCVLFDGWRLNRMIAVLSLMQPASVGSLRLNSSDPYGPPLIALNYFGDSQGRDLATAVEGLKKMLALAEPLAKLGLTLDTDNIPECASNAFGSDAHLRCVARARTATSWHWVGTAPMGAVLDSQLRVRGVQGLRVADGSAIPILPSGNTNNPVMMVAEIAADLIKQASARG